MTRISSFLVAAAMCLATISGSASAVPVARQVDVCCLAPDTAASCGIDYNTQCTANPNPPMAPLCCATPESAANCGIDYDTVCGATTDDTQVMDPPSTFDPLAACCVSEASAQYCGISWSFCQQLKKLEELGRNLPNGGIPQAPADQDPTF